MKNFIFLMLIGFCSAAAQAQEFGGNRFSVRWRQMDTDTARVVFPKGMDSAAKTVMNTVRQLTLKNLQPLGSRVKKINIVLQPNTTTSNGYVGLGPFRSEFYMMPPADHFDMGAANWVRQLTLHEYRHVQQYNNFYNGASKAMRWLFGQEGYALAINASVPNWFYEGDAVFQETALTPQGRGRMPSFLKAFPAIWQAGKKYNWMKLRNGSYKDYVPNHYELGYLLVNYGYEKYGDRFWGNVTRDASAFSGFFYPMQRAVKKFSGLRYRHFTTEAIGFYKKIFETTVVGHAAPPANAVTHDYYPQQISPDSVIYLRSSYRQRPAFYIQDKKGTRRLRFRNISIDEQFSYKNGKLVYAARENHPRWQWHQYSVIKILDLKTGKQKTLAPRTKYFSPDIWEDGKTIVANKVSEQGRSSLIVLSSNNAAILHEFSADSIAYFSNPKFLSPQEIVSAIRLQNGKNFIGVVNPGARRIKALTPAGYNAMGQVSVQWPFVFFSASLHLKDEIFSVNIVTKELQKLVSAQLTNYFPQAGFGKINFSSFTADGYRWHQLQADSAVWEKMDAAAFVNEPAGIVAEKDSSRWFLKSVPENDFVVKPYARLSRPFLFHSWRPNYDDPVYDFTVYGNNILNTVETQLRYQYNENEKTHAAGASMVYGGLFPFIHAGSKYIFHRQAVVSGKRKEWDQWENSLGISIPLSYAAQRSIKNFIWGTSYVHRTDFNKGFYKDSFNTVRFGYLLHQLSWAQQIQKARMDVFPRLGYSFNLQVRHTLNQYRSWQLLARGLLFLPGFLPSHSFNIAGAYQEAGVKDKIFSNRFPFARGIHAVDSAQLAGVTLNYHFPLAYPDWGFANIFYLQRLRTNLFFDYTKICGKSISYPKELMSAGAELFFDTKWWNQHPVTFGVRGGYPLKPDPITKKQKPFFEFILPVSLIPK